MGAWALLSLVAAAVDLDASATAESRAGRAPLVPGAPPQSTLISALTPAVGLEVGAYTNRLRLQYGPRLSWVSARRPDPGRPYIMHLAEAALGLQPAASAALNVRARASTGDTDYTALTQIVGRTQSALPEVTGLTSLEGRLELGLIPAAAWLAETSVEVAYREPIFTTAGGGTPPPAGGGGPMENPFPRHLSIEGAQTLNHRVTRRDTLLLRVGVGHDSLSSGLRMLAVSPTVGWQHALGPADSIRGGVGVTFAKQFAAPPGRPIDDGVTPLVDFALTSRLYHARDVVVSSLLLAGVTWYLDPVLAISGPRGNAGASLELRFPPKWTVSPSAFFSTSLREDRAPGTPVPDETLVTLALPVRYQFNRNLDLEFGLSMSDRGPHLEVDDFAFHQFEFWGYVMLTGRIGRDRPAPRAAARIPGETTGGGGAVAEGEDERGAGGRPARPGAARTRPAGAGPIRQSVTTRVGTSVYAPVTTPGTPAAAGSSTTDPAGAATRPGGEAGTTRQPEGAAPSATPPRVPPSTTPPTSTPPGTVP